MTDQPPVTVALIGCGNFARWQHLPNLARIAHARLQVVCDRDSTIAQTVAQDYDCEWVCDSGDVLANPAIDVVVLAVRDDLQADLCQQALAAGKHVYVEKPVGISIEEIEAVQAAEAASGRSVCVGFQKRCAPAYRLAKDILDADGGAHNLSLRMTDDAWRWATGYAPGSLIAHDVCHLFDLARWICNDEIQSLTASRSRPDDDAILLRMAKGCVVTITASGHATMDMPKERLDAIATRGGLTVEDFVELRSYGYPNRKRVTRFAGACHPQRPLLSHLLLAEQGAQALADIRYITWQQGCAQENGVSSSVSAPDRQRFIAETIPNFLRDQGWLAAMHQFLEDIAHNRPRSAPLAGVKDALQAARAAQAAYASIASGNAISL